MIWRSVAFVLPPPPRVRARPFTRPDGAASPPDSPRYPDAADPPTPRPNYGGGDDDDDDRDREARFETGRVVSCKIKIYQDLLYNHFITRYHIVTKRYRIIEYNIQILAVWLRLICGFCGAEK